MSVIVQLGASGRNFKRNPDAIQIGLTATPRQIKITEQTKEAEADAQITADNIRHFGEPVYEYDMRKVSKMDTLPLARLSGGNFINAKPQTEKQTGIEQDDLIGVRIVDADTGEPLSLDDIRRRYEAEGFERQPALPDRVRAMAKTCSVICLPGGPEQKTIIFCASDRHADDVAIAINDYTLTGVRRMDEIALTTMHSSVRQQVAAMTSYLIFAVRPVTTLLLLLWTCSVQALMFPLFGILCSSSTFARPSRSIRWSGAAHE